MAERGTSAVQAVRRVTPDIVLLDIGLPGAIDGIEVCRQIKSEAEGPPPFVIMMSGRKNHQDFVRARAAGANAYLVKPFKLSRLFDLVSNYATLQDRFILEPGN